MIEQTYRIDMIPDGAPVVVHVSQYDTAARRLSFELYNGGVAYELPAGDVASIAGTKPDNTSFLYAMTVSGNIVSIDLKQQMALVAGDVPAEIQITGAEGKIGSANFIIRVERGPIDENSVISETDLPIFEQLVSDAQTAVSDAQTAVSDAQTAANTASAAASSVASIVPASPGSAGQVLTKTANGADWADKYPSGGTAGQVLTKTANGEAWEDVDGLPAGGTTGQVLTKNSSTSGDASWQTPQSGGGTWGSITGTLSDQTDLQNALNAKANTSTLATVESTSTASQAYSAGDYLILNGQLYKVTADVASGETLVIGTNIEATTAGAELKALNKDLESHYMNYETLENEYVTVNPSIVNTSEYYKVEIWSRNTEAFVQVSFKLKTAVSNSSSQTVLNFTSKITELLSATYRTFPGFIESGTYAGRNCVLHLDTWNDTKKLEMYNTLGGSIPVGSQMTFSFYVMK